MAIHQFSTPSSHLLQSTNTNSYKLFTMLFMICSARQIDLGIISSSVSFLLLRVFFASLKKATFQISISLVHWRLASSPCTFFLSQTQQLPILFGQGASFCSLKLRITHLVDYGE